MEKVFKVTSIHNVYEDSFNDGEGDNVNNYTIEAEINAKDWKEAVTRYFEQELFYKFDIKDIEVNEDKDFIYYSVLVDNEQLEPSESDIEEWKLGNIKLYSNNIAIFMSEMFEVKFN